MTTFSAPGQAGGARPAPALLVPHEQEAVWFLGALVRARVGAAASGGQLAVLEHTGERGYGSPLHRHDADEETFLVLEGELRIEVGDTVSPAGPGAAAFLPRNLPHAFVVTSPTARFLTLHTPAGFDAFTLEAGTPATSFVAPPPDELPPEPATLAAMAARYDIEILGPPPQP